MPDSQDSITALRREPWRARVTVPEPGELQLWFTSLVPRTWPPRWREQMSQLLSPAERERVDSGINQKIRDRTLASRSSLRRLLGYALGQSPGSITIETSDRGRPFVPGLPFDFNVAHAGDLMVIATTGRGLIGVDLEIVAEFSGMSEIAADRFERSEATAIAEAAPGERARLFHRAWTRYEAFLKATGEGLLDDADDDENDWLGNDDWSDSEDSEDGDEDEVLVLANFQGPGGTIGATATSEAAKRLVVAILPPV